MSGKVRKKEKRKRVIILLSTLSVLLMAVVLWNIYDRSGSKNISSQTNESTQTGEIVWNGNSYTYNEHLSNFLFLGIDNREKEAASVGHADAGQADALYLLSWDRVETVSYTHLPVKMTLIKIRSIEVQLLQSSLERFCSSQ